MKSLFAIVYRKLFQPPRNFVHFQHSCAVLECADFLGDRLDLSEDITPNVNFCSGTGTRHRHSGKTKTDRRNKYLPSHPRVSELCCTSQFARRLMLNDVFAERKMPFYQTYFFHTIPTSCLSAIVSNNVDVTVYSAIFDPLLIFVYVFHIFLNLFYIFAH